MIDLNLLRMMKYRETYYKIRGRVPEEALDTTTCKILEDYGKYFNKFVEHKVIDFATFVPMFNMWHPKLGPDHVTAYAAIFDKAKADVPEDSKSGIMLTLMELRLGSDLASLLLQFENGDLENIHKSIEEVVSTFKIDANIKSMDFIRDKIGDLLEVELDDSGLRWRLHCLNQSMRGVRGGDFIVVAGRPDKGKTTFLASELSFMSEQLPAGKTMLWLNNEGPGKRIIPRLYQAALGLKMSEMLAMHKEGTLEKAYEARMGMPWRMRVFDIHGMDTYAVERIIEQNNTGIVCFDMIDNVRGFGDAARTDLALEKMYQWARELCVKYDCAGFATSQISQDGDGLQFPTLPMLKDSKTGKQGACDVQLMIGASNDGGQQNYRYIGLPKNKLRREGGLPDPRATVNYQPQMARYNDVPDTEDTPDEESPI